MPEWLLPADADLTRVSNEIKDRHRLDISVVGSGSSALSGPDGARFAYPAQLEQSLRERLPGIEIKVTAHVQSRQTTADMASGLQKILTDDQPALVIWQAGTVDALRGVEPEDFRTSLDQGIDAIAAAHADVIMMNMQHSPRTESMLGVSAYADVMRWVAEQHGVVLFDRLAIMRYWSDEGVFDLYAATKDYAMARRVHECIGRALASLIINAGHLDAGKIKRRVDVDDQTNFQLVRLRRSRAPCSGHARSGAGRARLRLLPRVRRSAEPAPCAPAQTSGFACSAPAEVTRLNYPLRHAARRLASGEPLTIVAIGSSSTAGAGASSPAASYPSRLAVELKQRFPTHDITVLNRGVNGETTEQMMARFATGVIAAHPDLVLWQVGTNSVLRDRPLRPHSVLLHEGVAQLKEAGADVILIDMQFAPRVLAKPETEGMEDQIAVAAKDEGVDLFRRFAVMRNWHEVQHIPFDTFVAPDALHMNDWGYGCVAKLLAAGIADAATRPVASASARSAR